MRLQRQRLTRAVAGNYLILCMSMTGIYGVNRITARQILLMTLVMILFMSIAWMFGGHGKNSGSCAIDC